ncbi:MAG: adenine deaminase [candidate division NC10 bacterium]|nr:adenine deaminase [candidate division NC10 bacterium]
MRDDVRTLAEAIDAGALRREADCLLEGVRLLNVFTGEVARTNVAVAGGRIVGIGEAYRRARETFALDGRYLLPGLIEGHIHVESSLLTPEGFAEAVVPRGTTTVVADPHEIANVLGVGGVQYMLRASQGLPLDCFFQAPSCVPSSPLETAGASLGPPEVAALLAEERILGLAEMMDYPGVIRGGPENLEKILAARSRGKVVDGHAPGLTGEGLVAYLTAGIGTDHECTTLEEAREKLRLGMRIMIREGSQAKNMADLLPLVRPESARRFLLVSDDREAQDLLREGHLDALLRRAISLGLPPHLAVQMVTLNPAEAFGLSDRGAVAPGRVADLVLVDSLQDFTPLLVFKEGRLVAREGRLLQELPRLQDPATLKAVQVGPLSANRLRLTASGGRVRVIEVVPGQIVTRGLVLEAPMADGEVRADPARDVLKLAVLERHGKTGNVGLGLVRGFGLREGALASSIAHDSHNLIAVGVDDRDLLAALEEVIRMRGGLAVAAGGTVRASLALPVAGLMSPEPAEKVGAAMDRLCGRARDLGSPLLNPFAVLSFLALPVIPELRLTDRGLVDVERGELVPLAAD